MRRNKTIPQIAKSRRNRNEIIELSTGYFAKINNIPLSVIDEAQMAVPYPEVPMWANPDKGRDEPNPNDPTYIKACQEIDMKRGNMVLDATIMFCLELVKENGTPFDFESVHGWDKKVVWWMARKGDNPNQYDWESPVDREFLFKKYIAVGVPDVDIIRSATGLSEEAIEEASEKFRTNT